MCGPAAELMEAALEENFAEGVALLDRDGRVVFWNHAAEKVTGFPGIDVVSRVSPFGLQQLRCPSDHERADGNTRLPPRTAHQRQFLVHAQHHSGLELPLMIRRAMLRDGLGERIGVAIVFHFAESIDTLPHGESCEEADIESAQAEIEEQARAAFEEFLKHDAPTGPAMDQGWIRRQTAQNPRSQSLRNDDRKNRTDTLTNGLRPMRPRSEPLGR